MANGVVYAYQSGKDSTETRALGAARGVGAARGASAANAARGAGPGRGAGANGTTGAGAARGSGATAAPASIGTNAILYAFDAETGKQLFSSELDSFNHFTNPVVADGTVYAVTWDGKLYAFGLEK